MSVISLYSGAGGIDYGFEAAGFDTSVCLDFDADACATLSASRPWRVLHQDVHDVTPQELLAEAQLRPGEAEVLIGGPPCQPFSKSGFWVRGHALRLEDPRAQTIGKYLEIVRVVKPQVIFFENVDAIGYAGKDEGLQYLLAGLRQIDQDEGTMYMAQPSSGVVDAANYGVPQRRSRFILVAARDGRPFEFPRPTHGSPEQVGEGVAPYRTAWDAIGDLNDIRNVEDLAVQGKWADLLPSIPEGQNYLFHTVRNQERGGLPLFGWRTRFWCFLLKLGKDQPSWTLQAQPGPATGPFHWSNRYLSARELCRLQTFPDDVNISGGRRAAQKQLGNAVPSLLAEVFAREIRRQLLDLPVIGHRPRLLPPFRGPSPSPERVQPVAKKYLHLVGDHAAHPGTGKGPGALARMVTT